MHIADKRTQTVKFFQDRNLSLEELEILLDEDYEKTELCTWLAELIFETYDLGDEIQKHKKEWFNIMDALVDSVDSASEEELHSENEDSENIVSSTRATMLDAVKAFKQSEWKEQNETKKIYNG
jgi:hypothetical protein